MKYFIAKQRYLESHNEVTPKGVGDKSKDEETMRRNSSSNLSFEHDPNSVLTSLKPGGENSSF